MKNPENLHRTPQILDLLQIESIIFSKSVEKLTNLSTTESCPQRKIVLSPISPLWTGFTVLKFWEFDRIMAVGQ
jgi:hypothetical protein